MTRPTPSTLRKTNVREVPSPLVGRAVDLRAIEARFDAGARLVTLIAPGGMGKTRVAQRYAAQSNDRAESRPRFVQTLFDRDGGGAWFCDLTGATDAVGVCTIVASALSVASDARDGDRAIVSTLGAAIGNRGRILIVLDNFEDAVDAAAATVGAWMVIAPQARFLVTSRISLNLPGEQRWSLAPLALPSGDVALDALVKIESAQLLLDRVRAIRPGLVATDDDVASIVEIVRAADGIPLAIELAAARATVLSFAEIRERMAAPLAMLVRSHDVGRHASMRRAIEASY
ncbi:MAG: AAA family ATPase, partial [Polyangiales bacterium]